MSFLYSFNTSTVLNVRHGSQKGEIPMIRQKLPCVNGEFTFWWEESGKKKKVNTLINKIIYRKTSSMKKTRQSHAIETDQKTWVGLDGQGQHLYRGDIWPEFWIPKYDIRGEGATVSGQRKWLQRPWRVLRLMSGTGGQRERSERGQRWERSEARTR